MSNAVLLVHRSQMFTEALRFYLQSKAGQSLHTQTTSAEECLRCIKSTTVHTVVAEIHTQQVSGIELCKAVKQISPHTNYVLLSSTSTSGLVKKAVRAGANSFVMIQSGLQELVTAIQHSPAKDAYLCSNTTKSLAQGSLRINGDQDQVPDILTNREAEILELMAQGLSNSDIAAALYISENTVKTHRKHIMKKLSLKNLAEAVRYQIKYFE